LSDHIEIVNECTGSVIAAAMKVHSVLGPGLLERAYEACLAHELMTPKHRVRRQVPVPIIYDSIRLDEGYRLDLLVDDIVVVELKAAERMMSIHDAQVLSYLKLSGKKIGLLINFNVLHLRDGIRRIVNGL
jgi:GxxExxY protein